MKLSEQLAQLGAVDEDGQWARYAIEARTLEQRSEAAEGELEILRSREEYGWSETAAMEEATRRDLLARAAAAEDEVARLREERDFARRHYDLWRDQAKEYAVSRDALRAKMEKVREELDGGAWDYEERCRDALRILDGEGDDEA